MKKIYSTPLVEIKETQTFQMMALSLQEGKADGSDALSRDDAWDMWGDDED